MRDRSTTCRIYAVDGAKVGRDAPWLVPGPKSPEHQALGEVIRQARRQRGVSQEQLATDAGLNRVYTGGVERGEINLSFGNLLLLLAALELSVGEFGARYERQLTSASAA